MEALEEAGFLDAVKEKGFPGKIRGQVCKEWKDMRLFFCRSVYQPGWNWTWQVPRAEFDKTLADEV